MECELQNYAKDMHIIERRIRGNKCRYKIDRSSVSIVKEPSKCIICSRCVRVCEENMLTSTFDFSYKGNKTFISTTWNEPMNSSNCISCGQCIMVCPTAALHERPVLSEVMSSLHNPGIKTVVQVDPAVPVTIAWKTGLQHIRDFNRMIYALLRKAGFYKVFEISPAFDIMILELAEELNQRMSGKKNLPLITSCCPSWVKFLEQFYPDLLPHLAGCKSHPMIGGAVIKEYLFESEKLTADKIVTVAVMPCTSRKSEAARIDLFQHNNSDIQFVLTTRELMQLIKMNGLNIQSADPENADYPLATGSYLASRQGLTGTTMEAILKTMNYRFNGKTLENNQMFEFNSFTDGYKSGVVNTGNTQLKVAIVNGLKNCTGLLNDIRNHNCDLDVVEVMACYGGCSCGGGQPYSHKDSGLLPQETMYEGIKEECCYAPVQNIAIQEFTANLFGKPMSAKNIELFHKG